MAHNVTFSSVGGRNHKSSLSSESDPQKKRDSSTSGAT